MKFVDMPLYGSTAIEFERQIEEKIRKIENDGMWEVKMSKDGNPVPVDPAVIVMYRADQRFTLDAVLPKMDCSTGENCILSGPQGYDLVIASQPFRSRASAESKCKNVLLPLTRALKPAGRLVVVQSTGHDPGMEIVQSAWPGEMPFATPRHILQAELFKQLKEADSKNQLAGAHPADFTFGDSDQFRYELHSLPDSGAEMLGTSLLLATWNAAVYVAQIDEERCEKLIATGEFVSHVQKVVEKYGQLWFANEAFVIARKPNAVS